MNESEFRYVDDPAVAVREDGHVGVAWADNDRKDVFFQVFDSRGNAKSTAPVNVSRSPTIFSWLPRLVMTADREVFVLWQEIVFSGGSHGGEIFFSRSQNGGESFAIPINLSNSIGGDGKGRLTKQHWDNGSLDLVRGADGTLFAAWTEYDGVLWFSRSTDAGHSFSKPSKVNGSSQEPARGPALAAGRAGSVYLAWTVGEDESADIRFAVSLDHGQTFGPTRIAFRSEGHSDAPQIAVDERGVVHLVHGERANGPFGPSHVRYARLDDANGAFEAPRDISLSP